MFRLGAVLDELDHYQERALVDSALQEVADLEGLVQGVTDLLLLVLTQTSRQAVHHS